mmetsp:Transcript_142598/g.263011  ORF Transcript_142598/g.263011 Transcript_142598/m.263011 type:complete len:468 (-) Transcript_142598:107-1510(-)
MCKIAIVLACLACAGHGRRVQTLTERILTSPPAVRPPLAHSPASAFSHLTTRQKILQALNSERLEMQQAGEAAGTLLDLRGGADEDASEAEAEEKPLEDEAAEKAEEESTPLEEVDSSSEPESASEVEAESVATPEPPEAPQPVATAPPPEATATAPAPKAEEKPAEIPAKSKPGAGGLFGRKSSGASDEASTAPAAALEPVPEMATLKTIYECNVLRSSVLAEAMKKVTAIRMVLESGEAIPEFGRAADGILNEALTKFYEGMPKGDAQAMELSEKKAEEMRSELMMSMEPAFVQQICLLKDAALELFKKGMADGDGAEAFASAEVAFARSASDCVPAQTGWSFELERESLVGAMKAILGEQKKASSAKIQSAQQMQTALAYLQLQQKQMEEIQGSAMRAQGSKWTLGAAYRPEDTSINLSAAYQQGRCNFQVSRVPDESANLLGADGFRNGVAPANLGLTFNIHF